MTRRAVIAAACALLLAGCQEEKEPAPPVRPVLFTTVEPQTVELFGPFASTVEARYQSQLGFQIAGRIIARDAYVGQRVHAGQRLAALDPKLVQFAFVSAKANVADAAAQLVNASGIEQRQRTLFGSGSAAKAVLDNAVAGRDTARARLEQAQAALRTAQDQLGYAQLHATFDGVITAWSAEVGQSVANGQAVVTVARPDAREASLDLPDALIGEVKPGMKFLIRLQADADVTAVGRVREIGPLADPATRTHHVRLALIDPPAAFRLGTTVSAAVERTVRPKVVLPASAILERNGHAFAWLVAPDGASVSRHEVAVAARNDETVTLSSGLARGDRVVTFGVHSLSNGQRVTIRTSAPAPDAAVTGTDR